ncbi:MAG: sulfate transporter CysZ [Desulfuromonas sp.]|nr:MAG: sulfate transporter CysZ [Desulfuromonas sp.]
MPVKLITSTAGQFVSGFRTPFASFGFVFRNPGLLRYIVIPFLINLLVFSLVSWLGLNFFSTTVSEWIPQGDAWYWATLYYFLWTLAFALTAVVVFFTFTVVGNLIASPFNELLSERTEELLTATVNDESFSLAQFGRDAIRALLDELKKMTVFVVLMLVIFSFNLIPAFGSLIYAVLATAITLYFLSIEYVSFTMTRKRLGFREQRRFIAGRKRLMLGFSCGVLLLLAIPLVQLLCIPMAVIGATRLWCEAQGQHAGQTP